MVQGCCETLGAFAPAPKEAWKLLFNSELALMLLRKEQTKQPMNVAPPPHTDRRSLPSSQSTKGKNPRQRIQLGGLQDTRAGGDVTSARGPDHGAPRGTSL